MAGGMASGDFLTFGIDGEAFAFPIESVLEVIELGHVRTLPAASRALKGLVDLRGAPVPVLDLRCLLGLAPAGESAASCVIIMQLDLGEGGQVRVGAIADTVHEVVNLGALGIEEAPRLGRVASLPGVRGICKHADSFVVILDASAVLAPELQEGSSFVA